jgi:hypothetical protein
MSVIYTLVTRRIVRLVLNHTGISALLGPIGSLPSTTFLSRLSGRGGAYSISIPAAKSSARVSIISFNSCISLLRKLAIRLSRVSLNSASLPWWTLARYSTILRSRSSAVLGFRILGLWVMTPSAERGESNCNELITYNKLLKYAIQQPAEARA